MRERSERKQAGFAECYANYGRNPEALAFLCSEKYSFMYQFVFHQNRELSQDFPHDYQFESWGSQDIRSIDIVAYS